MKRDSLVAFLWLRAKRNERLGGAAQAVVVYGRVSSVEVQRDGVRFTVGQASRVRVCQPRGHRPVTDFVNVGVQRGQSVAPALF